MTTKSDIENATKVDEAFWLSHEDLTMTTIITVLIFAAIHVLLLWNKRT